MPVLLLIEPVSQPFSPLTLVTPGRANDARTSQLIASSGLSSCQTLGSFVPPIGRVAYMWTRSPRQIFNQGPGFRTRRWLTRFRTSVVKEAQNRFSTGGPFPCHPHFRAMCWASSRTRRGPHSGQSHELQGLVYDTILPSSRLTSRSLNWWHVSTVRFFGKGTSLILGSGNPSHSRWIGSQG